MAAKSAQDLIKMMEKWFSNLPALPKSITDILVMIAPWIAIIVGVVGVLGNGRDLISGGLATTGVISPVLMLIGCVLLLASFMGLKDHKMKGWVYFFYAEVVFALSSIVLLNVPGFIGNLIVFYLLFQIKSYYK